METALALLAMAIAFIALSVITGESMAAAIFGTEAPLGFERVANSKAALAGLFLAVPFVVLALLAFGALLAWHRGVAFGARRDPVTLRRRAFVDHVRALGATYGRARASRFALAAYGNWAVDRMRDRLSPGGNTALFDLAATAAHRARMAETEVVVLFAEAKSATEPGLDDEPADLAKLHDLERLVFRTGGFT
ncbi:MAG TPA: hypothetical protein VJT73_09315 [Polyangiaceae bacterium]|nr:hypothetical protein [Polyangiaceae bacterium]